MAAVFPLSHSLVGSSKIYPSINQQGKPTTVDLNALQGASRVLFEQFTKDVQIVPDLGDILTASGSHASAFYSVYPDDIRVPYQKKKFVGIPDGLFQFYDSASVTSHMGLMPEIERVWISIDHKLFLWDYNEGQELASFVDQPDVITHVSLVKPKRGLFIDEITYVLVICTPVSVLLLGLSASPQTRSDNTTRWDIKLYATDLAVPSEIEMTSVIGTSEGRIFMCGSQDGYLYELHYQENETWFVKRVQLINHSVGGMQSLLPRFASSTTDERLISVVSDVPRNCFYTLSSKNTISVYKPAGDKSIQHIQTISGIYKAAQDKAPGSPALTPQNFQITSLLVIEPSESRSGVQLLAMTTSGVRLYFSPTTQYGYSYGLNPGTSTGQRNLQLIHVRLPPTDLLHPDEQANSFRPATASYGVPRVQPQQSTHLHVVSSLENSCYCDGLIIAAQVGDTDGTDLILCVAPDLTRIASMGQLNVPQQQHSTHQASGYIPNVGSSNTSQILLTEYATLLSIPGRTWAVANVPREPVLNPPGTPSPAVINELAKQFGEPPHQFVILTNVGLTFLVKRRAVDFLKAALEELQSEGNVQPVIEFRDSFGRDQACAMLLGVACSNVYMDGVDGSSFISPEIVSVAKQAFYDFGERPLWTERAVYGSTENKGSAIFSGRREGFALYFARLVRPIWKSKLTSTGSSGQQSLSVPDSTLVIIQKNLYCLKDFLDRNPYLFHSLPTEPSSSRLPITDQEAWKAEQSSVGELLSLLTRTIEALSFVLLLNDYQLGDLISRCDSEVQRLINIQTFEDLITTQNGMTISRALVNVVIDQQIGQQISIDTISEVLQQRCGSFCSTDDVMLYKAKENVRKAVETRNPNEKNNWLSEALRYSVQDCNTARGLRFVVRLFSKGARMLAFDNLREICGDFQQLSYAKGAIALPLTCAQISDPDKFGHEYWITNTRSREDGREPYEKRLQCYDLVMDSLTIFEERCISKNADGVVPNLDDPETVRTHAYELAFESEDEMFHSTLYDWLIGRDLADDLLEMRPPFLEAHLRREPVSVQKYQLLWQFYVKNGQPLRAAEVLGALAESTQFSLRLDARIEYLTLAVANAKSHPISAGGRHETAIAFLTDLEEKLDVAQVQLEIYNTLAPHISDGPEVAAKIRLLSEQLFTMTELYQGFAAAFDLPTMKLLCLHVSEYQDDTMIRPIWNQIFEEITQETSDVEGQADLIMGRIIPLGQRFYPSGSAFPLQSICALVVRFELSHKNEVAAGWASRIFVQCGVPFTEIWDVFHEMYESQVPPFNEQSNVQTISSEIAVLLSDWLEAATRPQSSLDREEIPVARVDAAIDQYIAELEPGRLETKTLYEKVKRQLRQHW